MGGLLLISRLVIGDIQRRRVQSALLLLMIVTTTTTLTLGLALRKTTETPFALTRAATRGPDLVAELQPIPGSSSNPTRPFAPLLHARGVLGTSGPYPVAFVRLSAPGINVPVQAEGRDPAPAAIDRPLVVAGHWVRPGSAVIERGLADALGVHPGETIDLNGHVFGVAGIALTTAKTFYPAARPGLIWLTRVDSERLATRNQPLGYVLSVKLADPASAAAFYNTAAFRAYANAAGNDAAILQPWQQIRATDYKMVSVEQTVLLIMSSLLAMLAIASIAVVVGGRMAEQTRRVGLIKAVGGTPGFVAVVLLAENLLLALGAGVAGLVAGELIEPLLINPGSGLLGTQAAPPLTVASAVLVIGAAAAVAAAATIMPAIRGARTSTLRALNDPAHPARRRPRLIALSTRLPVPLLLGLRLAARRTRRTVLTAASMAIAVAMVVAVITLQHQLDIRDQHGTPTGLSIGSSISGRVTHVVFLLSAILVVLAAITVIFTTWATVIDAERPTALARALGATPRQIAGGLTAAQLLPGLVAACLGIPAGFAVYQLAGGHLAKVSPPILPMLAVIPGTLLVVAALTALPARIGARRSVAEVLRAE